MKISLKAARTNVNITQRQAAEKLGVTKDTVAHWENGRSFPNALQIKDLEELYGVKYEEISWGVKI